MLTQQMELIFDAFPELLERYVEARGDDWIPDGVTWTYQTRTGFEQVYLTLRKECRVSCLSQSRQRSVTEDGTPVGDAIYERVVFDTPAHAVDSAGTESNAER